MQNSNWIDLGHIGHKSDELKKLFEPFYLTELPIIDNLNDKIVVFIDYSIQAKMGVKVLTNCFNTENDFYKELSQKLINKYVTVN
jgi:hypothetical protein